jgi:hypothetical protein
MAKVQKDNNQYFSLMVYGPSGVGKSVFAATFPKALYFDLEESSKVLGLRDIFPETKFIAPSDGFTDKQMVNMFQQALEQIKAGTFKYESLIVDSITKLEEIVIRGFQGVEDIMGSNLFKTRTKLNFDKWGAISSSTQDIVENIKAYKVNLVYVAQAQLKQLAGDTGERYYPAVTGSSAMKLTYKFDYVGYMDFETVGMNNIRTIRFNKDASFEAKGRFKGDMTDSIDKPHYSKILKLINRTDYKLDFGEEDDKEGKQITDKV